ncbi:uncharacterized protein AB9W97_006287 [Spinachia spinachia]
MRVLTPSSDEGGVLSPLTSKEEENVRDLDTLEDASVEKRIHENSAPCLAPRQSHKRTPGDYRFNQSCAGFHTVASGRLFEQTSTAVLWTANSRKSGFRATALFKSRSQTRGMNWRGSRAPRGP